MGLCIISCCFSFVLLYLFVLFSFVFPTHRNLRSKLILKLYCFRPSDLAESWAVLVSSLLFVLCKVHGFFFSGAISLTTVPFLKTPLSFFFYYFRLPKFSTLPLFAPDCHRLVSLSERNQRFCLNVVLRISSVKTTSTHLYTQPPARSQSTDSMHSNSLPWCDKDICETLSKSVDAFILQSSTYGEFFWQTYCKLDISHV